VYGWIGEVWMQCGRVPVDLSQCRHVVLGLL
jgi:hypothetical protein